MENSPLANKIPFTSRLPLVLILVIAAINFAEWQYGGRSEPGRLLVGVGFLLCAPHMYYSPRGFFSFTKPVAKTPGWTVVAIIAGLMLVVSGFVLRRL
jgi:hypothetical protein